MYGGMYGGMDGIKGFAFSFVTVCSWEGAFSLALFAYLLYVKG